MKKNRSMKVFRACVLALGLVYVIVAAMLFFSQRNMLYLPHLPSRELPPAPSELGLKMEVVNVQTTDGLSLLAWYAAPRKNQPVVVVYHGNTGNVAHRAYIAEQMMKQGYGVLMLEYRGYGGNDGKPTEEGLYTDARASLKWLGKKGFKPSRLVYYGESLGTGVAVQMALEAPPRAIVLQSPYSSILDVAAPHFWFLPVAPLIRDKFDSASKVGKIHAPLLIIHGDKDNLIPITLAQKLYRAANQPKKFLTVHDAGHNLLMDGALRQVMEWVAKQETK